MIRVRPRTSLPHERGSCYIAEWHFAPGDFKDREFERFGDLRLFGHITLAPYCGLPLTREENVELVTYCTAGRLVHADGFGNEFALSPGDALHMTAGSGLEHAESDGSDDETRTSFLVMGFWPDVRGLQPQVRVRRVSREERLARWLPLVTDDGADSQAIRLHSEAEVRSATVAAGASLPWIVAGGLGAYVFVAQGGPVEITTPVEGSEPHRLEQGWAAAITQERLVRFGAPDSDVELVLVRVGLEAEPTP